MVGGGGGGGVSSGRRLPPCRAAAAAPAGGPAPPQRTSRAERHRPRPAAAAGAATGGGAAENCELSGLGQKGRGARRPRSTRRGGARRPLLLSAYASTSFRARTHARRARRAEPQPGERRSRRRAVAAALPASRLAVVRGMRWCGARRRRPRFGGGPGPVNPHRCGALQRRAAPLERGTELQHLSRAAAAPPATEPRHSR